jgi:hypothetical protein
MMLPRFGNGQFAVLVLCLTLADLLTVVAGLVGGLALEVNCLLSLLLHLLQVGHMTWAGDSLGCQLYYFLTSWLLGLANYLVAVLLSLLHVKRSTGWSSRLAECRTLLLLLTLATLLPALPELALRDTVYLDEQTRASVQHLVSSPLNTLPQVCIISAGPVPYTLYTAVKLVTPPLPIFYEVNLKPISPSSSYIL